MDRHLARYGPTDRYHAAPGAGMCLSAFALLRAPGGRTLVGRPAKHAAWNEWMPSWRHYAKPDLDATMAGRLLPATYLLEGEDPRAAIDRIMRGLLGIKRYSVAHRPRVYSTTSDSDWYPGHKHWDIAFVYDVTGASKPKDTPPWWRELSWTTPSEVGPEEFGWNEDLARWLKVAR